MKKYIYIQFIIILFAKFIFCQTPIYKSGYPMIIDTFRSPFQKAGMPFITDFEKDGQKEILFFVIDYFGSANPHYLYVIKSDGSNYPNFPKGYNEVIMDINSGDVDGDGFLDIALRMQFSIDVIDRFGNHLPGFPVPYSISGDNNTGKAINLYDLDNDGKLEIVVSKKGEISVYNFNGLLRSGWPRYIAGSTLSNVAIGDIDNNGNAEIVAATVRLISNGGSDSSAIRIFKENGENFSSSWPVYSDSLYGIWGASPSLVINKNFLDSTFINISTYRLLTGGVSNNRLTKYNLNGQIVDRGYKDVLNVLGTLVIGDIDNDGLQEFTNGAQGSPNLSLYSNKLIKLSGWPNEGDGEHWATPAIGKLTYSNNLNIVDNNWAAYAPNGYGNIFAYNKDGSPLPWSPMRPLGLVEGITLSDIDNDGSIELIATSSRGYETFLHIWTIQGIPFTHENFPWPMNGHDRYRTNQSGFIPPDEPVGIQPTSTFVPDKFTLEQNFPNPFNPTTNIKFDIKSSANIKLAIYDQLGREIETLVNEELKAGKYSLTFDGSNFTSGVYFYRLQSEQFSKTLKMLLIK